MPYNPLYQAFLDANPIYENDVNKVPPAAYMLWMSERRQLFSEVHPEHMFDRHHISNLTAWENWITKHEYRKFLKTSELDYHCPWK